MLVYQHIRAMHGPIQRPRRTPDQQSMHTHYRPASLHDMPSSSIHLLKILAMLSESIHADGMPMNARCCSLRPPGVLASAEVCLLPGAEEHDIILDISMRQRQGLHTPMQRVQDATLWHMMHLQWLEMAAYGWRPRMPCEYRLHIRMPMHDVMNSDACSM